MKALSIPQPWAWAVIHAGNDWDSRYWSNRSSGMRQARALLGQRFLIHAAKGMTRAEYERALAFMRHISRMQPGLAGVTFPPMDDLPRGGIVGSAVLGGIIRAETAASFWYFGPVGLFLRDAQALPFVACKGQLGFFDVAEGGERWA